jgi:dihydrofolate reductase
LSYPFLTVKISVFVATSLDGYIARNDGTIDWLEKANKMLPPGEDYGYNKFIESVDLIVMGRNTYDSVRKFDIWPYENKHVIILTSKHLVTPPNLESKVSAIYATPKELIEILNDQGVRSVYLDGGITIQSFLSEGLVDEITITLIPVLLGDGRTLFGQLSSDIQLKHVNTINYESGFVQIKYRVGKY